MFFFLFIDIYWGEFIYYKVTLISTGTHEYTMYLVPIYLYHVQTYEIIIKSKTDYNIKK